MDTALTTALADLIVFLQTNFWCILLIVALVANKRTCGILLLFLHVIFGFNKWIYLAVLVFGIIGIGMGWDEKYVKRSENKSYDENDPDYME